MLAVKGGARGGRNPHMATKKTARIAAKKVPLKVRPEDIEDEEYIPQQQKHRPARVQHVEAKEHTELPSRISVKRSDWLAHLPGSIWQQSPFKWDPVPFGIESERLHNDKIIDAVVQDDSLKRFVANPKAPVVYGVCGNPSEEKARYFAAYLVDLHCKFMGSKANPVWHTLYGGYDNKLLKDYAGRDPTYDPSILVLCNLNSGSTNVKLEKAKDLLERFSTIPRIVVAAGEDPISFLSTKLYAPCNALAYFPEALIRRKVEVI